MSPKCMRLNTSIDTDVLQVGFDAHCSPSVANVKSSLWRTAMKAEPQTCSLCGANAVFYLADHGNRKYFSCPRCSKFQISHRAEGRLADAPEQARRNYVGKARLTPPDHLLVIVVSSPPDFADMVGEYLPNSDLPL